MTKVHKDIGYIYKEYDLYNYHYQEINQEDRVIVVKNKWVSEVGFGEKAANTKEVILCD